MADERTTPYSSGELMRAATSGQPLDALRVLATYADPGNWRQVYADKRCYWAWSGPTITGYEFAANGVKDGCAALAQAERERDELRQWVHDLQAGMFINCVYCGHRYGPDDEVPATMADALKEHVEQCPKHPMSQVKSDRDAARAEVEELERRASRMARKLADEDRDAKRRYEYHFRLKAIRRKYRARLRALAEHGLATSLIEQAADARDEADHASHQATELARDNEELRGLLREAMAAYRSRSPRQMREVAERLDAALGKDEVK